MIKFDRFILKNGLTVIVHSDFSTPLVAVNVLYDVGARDEHPDRTGFAHLFEHLMFGGSVNIPRFDEPLENVGGENNAFTSSDITNYYITIPRVNLETAFWLESDRMLSLAFSKKSLDVQRNVVSQEFNQVYLNQPYGDLWLLLKPLAYKVHPYQWNTIGKSLDHIRQAKMKDVKAFFKKYYCPSNAILVVAGNVTTPDVKKLTQKWFEPIPSGKKHKRDLPVEPKQTKERKKTVYRNVPYDVIYKAYHTCARTDPEFYTNDLISDLLSNGKSSRLYQSLVKKKKLFSEVNAYLSGDIDKGLFIVTGKLLKGVSMKDAELSIDTELQKICKKKVDKDELQKVKNKIESTLIFSELSVLNKAMNLASAELIGNAEDVNTEIEHYLTVTPEMIQEQAQLVFKKTNCSTLYYLSKNNQ